MSCNQGFSESPSAWLTPTHHYETEALTAKNINFGLHYWNRYQKIVTVDGNAAFVEADVFCFICVPYEVKEINVTPYEETTSVRPSLTCPTVWFPRSRHISNLLKKELSESVMFVWPCITDTIYKQPTKCNSNGLLIIPISSTCFGR